MTQSPSSVAMLRRQLLPGLGRIGDRGQLHQRHLGGPLELLLRPHLQLHLRPGLPAQAVVRGVPVRRPPRQRGPLRGVRSGSKTSEGFACKTEGKRDDDFQLLGVVFAHMLAKAVRRIKTEMEMESQASRQRFYAELVADKENKERLSSTMYKPTDA